MPCAARRARFHYWYAVLRVCHFAIIYFDDMPQHYILAFFQPASHIIIAGQPQYHHYARSNLDAIIAFYLL